MTTVPLRLLILFGSETGTAQDYAESLWQNARRRNIPTLVRSMNSYNAQHLFDEQFAVFVCSTTGQGEEPDNMKSFWRFLLRRNLPSDSLANTHFAVLGLGDSSYQKFNFVAKRLFRRLVQLSAKSFMPLALADDQHEFGSDLVVDKWMDTFWNQLQSVWPNPIEAPQSQLLPIKFQLVYDNSLPNAKAKDRMSNGPLFASYESKEPFFARVASNDRVTPEDHFQETRLVKLAIGESGLVYSPGDVVVVQPKNLQESIELFTSLCPNLDYVSSFALEPSDPAFEAPPHFVLPQPCTFADCIANYFDLQMIPRRRFFKDLSAFAVDEREREKLEEFSSPANQDDLYTYCNRQSRSVVEVLMDFHDTASRVPVERWFDLLAPIRPRSFSIASSPKIHLNEIHVLVTVVRYKTKLAQPRLGLCSNWLARLTINARIPIWVRKGSFQSIENGSPFLMIGPGTGVAPFRSIIHNRAADSLNANVLFFGCRNKKADFYFKREFDELIERKALTLFTAFSRDQENKVYVQHKIEENWQLVADLVLNQNCFVFVAGSSKQMPKDVESALKVCVKRATSMEDAQVDAFFAQLEKQHRLQMETWS